MNINYKIMMHAHGGRWNVMDDEKNYDKAVVLLKKYRESIKGKKFRLEKVTVEVLDV